MEPTLPDKLCFNTAVKSQEVKTKRIFQISEKSFQICEYLHFSKTLTMFWLPLQKKKKSISLRIFPRNMVNTCIKIILLQGWVELYNLCIYTMSIDYLVRIGDTFRYGIALVAKLVFRLWTLLWGRLRGNIIHHLLSTCRAQSAFISVMAPRLKIHCPSVSRLKHMLHFDVIFIINVMNHLNHLGPNQWLFFKNMILADWCEV